MATTLIQAPARFELSNNDNIFSFRNDNISTDHLRIEIYESLTNTLISNQAYIPSIDSTDIVFYFFLNLKQILNSYLNPFLNIGNLFKVNNSNFLKYYLKAIPVDVSGNDLGDTYQSDPFWMVYGNNNNNKGDLDLHYTGQYGSGSVGNVKQFLQSSNYPTLKRTLLGTDETLSYLNIPSTGGLYVRVDFYNQNLTNIGTFDVYNASSGSTNYHNTVLIGSGAYSASTQAWNSAASYYKVNIGNDNHFLSYVIVSSSLYQVVTPSQLFKGSTCRTINDYITIVWRNPLGGYDRFYFNNRKQTNSIDKIDFKVNNYRFDTGSLMYTNTRTVGYGGTSLLTRDRITLASTVKRQYIITSPILNDSEYEWLQELIQSGEVYLFENNIYKPIKILDSSYQVKQKIYDRLSRLQITYEESENII